MQKNVVVMVLCASLGLMGCNETGTSSSAPGSSATAESELSQQKEAKKLSSLLEDYFEQSMALSPVSATFVGIDKYNDQFSLPINKKNLAFYEEFEKRYLQEINAIDATLLSG